MKTKPVIEIPNYDFFMPENVCEYWFYYQDRCGHSAGYGSDSLINLKKKVRELRLFSAEINTRSGQFTYGQNFVDFYFYKPRYSLWDRWRK